MLFTKSNFLGWGNFLILLHWYTCLLLHQISIPDYLWFCYVEKSTSLLFCYSWTWNLHLRFSFMSFNSFIIFCKMYLWSSSDEKDFFFNSADKVLSVTNRIHSRPSTRILSSYFLSKTLGSYIALTFKPKEWLKNHNIKLKVFLNRT